MLFGYCALALNDNSIYGEIPLVVDAHAVNTDEWGWPGLNGNPVDHYSLAMQGDYVVTAQNAGEYTTQQIRSAA